MAQTGFLVFEICERGEVFEMIAPSAGLQPRENIGSYFSQLVAAVVHIHSRGICHLDIKPENLFVDASGKVKLGDFGLATLAEDGPVMGCRGSLAYVAPSLTPAPVSRALSKMGFFGGGQTREGTCRSQSYLCRLMLTCGIIDVALHSQGTLRPRMCGARGVQWKQWGAVLAAKATTGARLTSGL